MNLFHQNKTDSSIIDFPKISRFREAGKFSTPRLRRKSRNLGEIRSCLKFIVFNMYIVSSRAAHPLFRGVRRKAGGMYKRDGTKK